MKAYLNPTQWASLLKNTDTTTAMTLSAKQQAQLAPSLTIQHINPKTRFVRMYKPLVNKLQLEDKNIVAEAEDEISILVLTEMFAQSISHFYTKDIVGLDSVDCMPVFYKNQLVGTSCTALITSSDITGSNYWQTFDDFSPRKDSDYKKKYADLCSIAWLIADPDRQNTANTYALKRTKDTSTLPMVAIDFGLAGWSHIKTIIKEYDSKVAKVAECEFTEVFLNPKDEKSLEKPNTDLKENDYIYPFMFVNFKQEKLDEKFAISMRAALRARVKNAPPFEKIASELKAICGIRSDKQTGILNEIKDFYKKRFETIHNILVPHVPSSRERSGKENTNPQQSHSVSPVPRYRLSTGIGNSAKDKRRTVSVPRKTSTIEEKKMCLHAPRKPISL